jgi:hypothetical protein
MFQTVKSTEETTGNTDIDINSNTYEYGHSHLILDLPLIGVAADFLL